MIYNNYCSTDVPYFLQTPLKSYNLKFMDSSTFNCDAIGKSAPKITWLRNGQPLSDSESDVSITYSATNESGNSTLVIQSLDQSDSGPYTCQAENDQGISQYHFMIDVYGKLNIHNHALIFISHCCQGNLISLCV